MNSTCISNFKYLVQYDFNLLFVLIKKVDVWIKRNYNTLLIRIFYIVSTALLEYYLKSTVIMS